MQNKLLKIFTLSLISLSTLSLGGCNKEDPRVFIDYGTIRNEPLNSITDLAELNYDDLLSKISHKESFILAIYNEGCGCWTDFAPVLTEFINDTGCNVSYMNVNKFINKDDLGLYLVKADLPSVAIFKKGKLAIQAVYIRDDRMMFKDYQNHFKKFIEANVVLPKMYYINKDILDTYIAEEKEFTLYVGRNGCPDCTAIERDVLYTWSNEVEKANEKLYVFDIEEYRGTEEYQNIKDMYGLSEENNPILGYSTGMLPTFQRRKGNQIKDMIVVLNDGRDVDTKKVKSYFTKARLEKMPFIQNSTLNKELNDMTLTDEQSQNWATYKLTYNEKYHYPITRLFIDSYVR